MLPVCETLAIVALAPLTDRAKLDAQSDFLVNTNRKIYVVHTLASFAVIALWNVADLSDAVKYLLLGTWAGPYVPVALVQLYS